VPLARLPAQEERIMKTHADIVARAHNFLDLLTAKDMDAWADLWAEDAAQDMPFAPEGFPRRVVGRAALIRHYAELPRLTGRMEFLDREAHPIGGARTVLMEYRGEIEIIPTGRRYDNRYAGLFSFDADAKITLFREYFDPAVLVEAWGGTPSDGFGSASDP
jgi:ketosteroid isomerase-like protein